MVWLSPGILAVYGASLDASAHSHHAIQIVWPCPGASCRVMDCAWDGPVVVQSGVAHKLQMDEGWVLLVEPQTRLGAQLAEYLGLCSSRALKVPLSGYPVAIKGTPVTVEALAPLFDENGMQDHLLRQLREPLLSGKLAHPRIQRLMRELDQCLPGVCLKPAHWRAAAVAKSLALSEGRFLHLFREHMGISWRPYLLWRRMLCAIGVLTLNRSATEAAHIAGFSDSSHLSRTFRRFLGMSIRQANRLFVHQVPGQRRIQDKS